MQQLLVAWQTAMGHWPIAADVRDVVWVKALLESVHIMAMGFVLFAVGVITLRFAGVAGQLESMAQTVHRFTPMIWAALAVVLITGFILLTGAGFGRGLTTPMFQLKLVTMVAAIVVTAALQLTAKDGGRSFWEMSPSRRAAVRVIAPLCLLLWLFTVCAGRWLAYGYVLFPNG